MGGLFVPMLAALMVTLVALAVWILLLLTRFGAAALLLTRFLTGLVLLAALIRMVLV